MDIRDKKAYQGQWAIREVAYPSLAKIGLVRL